MNNAWLHLLTILCNRTIRTNWLIGIADVKYQVQPFLLKSNKTILCLPSNVHLQREPTIKILLSLLNPFISLIPINMHTCTLFKHTQHT